jgi:ABC-type transporter Mla MlaB component
MVEIIKEKKTIKFSGDIKVNKIEQVYNQIIKEIEDIKSWEKIKLDISSLEEADSAFYQLILSLLRSFKDKIRISKTKKEIEEDMQIYRLFIKK